MRSCTGQRRVRLSQYALPVRPLGLDAKFGNREREHIREGDVAGRDVTPGQLQPAQDGGTGVQVRVVGAFASRMPMEGEPLTLPAWLDEDVAVGQQRNAPSLTGRCRRILLQRDLEIHAEGRWQYAAC